MYNIVGKITGVLAVLQRNRAKRPLRGGFLSLFRSASAAFALIVAPAWAGPAPDAQADGLKALDRRDYAAAQEIFAKLSADDPKDWSALFNLAFAEASLHQDDSAIDHLRRALTLKPGLPEAELNLGMLYVRDRKPQDAVAVLRDVVRQKPDNASAQRYLGSALFDSGDFPDAADAFTASLKTSPKVAPAELGLARSLMKQGKLDEARPHYLAACDIDPALKTYQLELAQSFAAAQRPNDAIEILKRFPEQPGAREQLGNLYLEAGNPDAAAEEFQAAVQNSPTTANKMALATAYLKGNRPELAEPILAEALRSNPNDFDVLTAVGKIEMNKKNYAVGANVFLAAAKLHPDSAETWGNAATCLMLSGQNPQALAAFDRLRELRAEKPGDMYFRAVLLDRMHQLKSALAAYQKFLAESGGKYPDQEFLARHRSIALKKELGQ